MKALLDTMAFLWWITDDPRLPQSARRVIGDSRNAIFFSSASAWEIAIKAGLGKLKAKPALAQWISAHVRKNNFVSLPITVRHAAGVYKLPAIHRDPFDRILVVQSQMEHCRIISNDPEIMKYSVRVVW